MRRSCLLAVMSLVVVARLSAGEPILEPGATPKLLLKNGAGEGPAWHPELGLLFSGDAGITRLKRDGTVVVHRDKAGTNGLLFDRKGRLVACDSDQRRIVRLAADGTVTVLTDRFAGKRYNQPNDLALDSRGRIYFTDPCYGSRKQMEMTDERGKKIEGVYRIDPDGTVTRILASEVDRPNGVRVSADDRYLYVADNNNNTVGAARKLWRFGLKADGSVVPESRKLLYDWGTSRGPDGIKLDTKGRLYVAGGLNRASPPAETNDKKGGIYVLSPEGKLLQFIPIERDEVTNCAFGEDDLRTLFITAGGSLWRVRVTTPGQVSWPAPK